MAPIRAGTRASLRISNGSMVFYERRAEECLFVMIPGAAQIRIRRSGPAGDVVAPDANGPGSGSKEEAKKSPAISPQPSAAANVKYISFAATAPMIPPGLRSRERVKGVEISRRWYT